MESRLNDSYIINLEVTYPTGKEQKKNITVGIYLSKVSKIALEQCPLGHCFNVILLTLDR